MTMFKQLFNLYLIIGTVSMLTILPAMYNIGLCKLGTDNNINFMDKVQCCIPVYGWFYARNLYSNHYLSFGGIANLIALIGFLLRISTMFIKSIPPEKKALFIAIFFFSLIISYFLFMVDIATVLLPVDSTIMWVPIKLILICIAPIAMAYVGAFLYNKVSYADKFRRKGH